MLVRYDDNHTFSDYLCGEAVWSFNLNMNIKLNASMWDDNHYENKKFRG